MTFDPFFTFYDGNRTSLIKKSEILGLYSSEISCEDSAICYSIAVLKSNVLCYFRYCHSCLSCFYNTIILIYVLNMIYCINLCIKLFHIDEQFRNSKFVSLLQRIKKIFAILEGFIMFTVFNYTSSTNNSLLFFFSFKRLLTSDAVRH